MEVGRLGMGTDYKELLEIIVNIGKYLVTPAVITDLDECLLGILASWHTVVSPRSPRDPFPVFSSPYGERIPD